MRVTRLTRSSAAVLGAALLLLGAPGCRTRPYDYGAYGEPDLSAVLPDGGPDDAALDKDLADFSVLPPDYNFPIFDLTIPRLNCGAYTIQTTIVTHADLLIVQDRSRSMAQGADGAQNPQPGQSKWELVRDAIEQVVAKTTSVDWGLLLFGDGSQCGVSNVPDVGVGPGNAAQIKNVLDNTALSPSTPTRQAISNAVAYLRGLGDKHPHYLMVATDGAPTCAVGGGNNDSNATIAAVKAAAGLGIPTFVVGIGTSTGAETTLDEMGKAGGVPNTTPGEPANYTVTNTADLVKILEAAALRITPCIYALPAAPPDPSRITVQGRGGVITRDTTRMNGWDLSDDGMSLVFYGDACDQMKMGILASVDTIYGCPGD